MSKLMFFLFSLRSYFCSVICKDFVIVRGVSRFSSLHHWHLIGPFAPYYLYMLLLNGSSFTMYLQVVFERSV